MELIILNFGFKFLFESSRLIMLLSLKTGELKNGLDVFRLPRDDTRDAL
jgi:hypothetical protein